MTDLNDSNSPQLDITWDPDKAQSNIAKHRVTFVQATSVLLDPLALTMFDATHSGLEERWSHWVFPLMKNCLRFPTLISIPAQYMSMCASSLHAMQANANANNTRMNPAKTIALR
jgi:hypothetical protein